SLDGPMSSRILRGGSWNNNNPDNLRSANRNRNQPDNRNNNISFRVASTRIRRSRRDRVCAWGQIRRAAR
ncbi:MAG: SUMF1/EgtB/PvdO family nonheme iron enzyme, partial [Bradyrhizobiaceae bacterium]|nr:SUMF1/EgtB/PvdO family nonheme iron enzyme [Bradyrhizobiaceae bacterium]